MSDIKQALTTLYQATLLSLVRFFFNFGYWVTSIYFHYNA